MSSADAAASSHEQPKQHKEKAANRQKSQHQPSQQKQKAIPTTISTGSTQILVPLDIVDVVESSSSSSNNNVLAIPCTNAAAAVASTATANAPPSPTSSSSSTKNICPLARTAQEKQLLAEHLGGGITAFRNLPIDALRKYIFVVTRPAELTSQNIATIYSSQKAEFCICAMYAPQFVDAAVKLGLLPMTIPFGKGMPEFLAPKLHTQRCIIRLPAQSQQPTNPRATTTTTTATATATATNATTKPTTLQLPEGIRKKSKKFALVLDGGFWDINCKEMVAHHEREHGHSWLNPYLQKTYAATNVEPEKFATNIHCICVVHASSVPAIVAAHELLRSAKSDDEKSAAKTNFDKVAQEAYCAGEIGCSVGTIYTSLTGGYTVSGTGSIQLGALAALLVKCGYQTWDLGMAMEYKTKNLGGVEVRRKQWLEIAAQQSTRQPGRRLGTLDGYVVRCDAIIDSVDCFKECKHEAVLSTDEDAAA